MILRDLPGRSPLHRSARSTHRHCQRPAHQRRHRTGSWTNRRKARRRLRYRLRRCSSAENPSPRPRPGQPVRQHSPRLHPRLPRRPRNLLRRTAAAAAPATPPAGRGPRCRRPATARIRRPPALPGSAASGVPKASSSSSSSSDPSCSAETSLRERRGAAPRPIGRPPAACPEPPAEAAEAGTPQNPEVIGVVVAGIMSSSSPSSTPVSARAAARASADRPLVTGPSSSASSCGRSAATRAGPACRRIHLRHHWPVAPKGLSPSLAACPCPARRAVAGGGPARRCRLFGGALFGTIAALLVLPVVRRGLSAVGRPAAALARPPQPPRRRAPPPSTPDSAAVRKSPASPARMDCPAPFSRPPSVESASSLPACVRRRSTASSSSLVRSVP